MLSIRPATVNDAGLLHAMIREFAEFERELELVVTTEADLIRDGFGAQPRFRTLIAEWEGKPAGYALFFGFYSTWQGGQGCFSRTCSCVRNFGRMVLARRSWRRLRA